LSGSAFSAKKQLTHETVVKPTPGQIISNEGEEDETEEKGSLDELSDEDINFVNSFDALRDTTATTSPVKKKLKKKTSLPLLVLGLKLHR
jgi:hypothetical protein